MGIEFFFGSLYKTFGKNSGMLLNIDNVIINASELYIDFNSIIYNIIALIEKELGYIFYNIIINNIESEKIKKLAEKYKYDLTINGNDRDKIAQFIKNLDKNKLIIKMIKKEIIHIITKHTTYKTINKIYISIDGVPIMSKIIEQRKRRYTGTIISGIRKHIFNLNKEIMTSDRIFYEENKFYFDRTTISVGSDFLKNINKSLISKRYKEKLHNLLPNLKQYIVSGIDEFGEGEKKIMEEILKDTKISRNIIIYSPDSDLIILGMIVNLLSNTKTYILRYNQQTYSHNLTEISTIMTGIYNYTKSKLNSDISLETVCLDLSYLMIMFGNDYIPAIISLDTKKDIFKIIDYYCLMINKTINKQLIYNNNGGYRINYDNLILYFKIASKDEIDLIQDKYLYKTYSNYKKIREVFENSSTTIVRELYYYVNMANILFDNITTNSANIIKLFADFTEKFNNKNKSNLNYEQFINNFIKLEKHFNKKSLFDSDMNSGAKLDVIIDELRKKEIMPTIKLFKYNDMVPDEIIEKSMVSGAMKITEYDRMNYSMEMKLNNYKKIMEDDNTNNIGISIIKRNNKHYYVFNIKLNDQTVFNDYYDNIKSDMMTQEYVKGLFWVFDFNYNRNNNQFNINNINTWTYNYNKSPFIKDIILYLNKNNIYKWIAELNNIYVKPEKFLTIQEHLMYITPANKIPFTDKNIILKKNELLFPNVEKIIKKVIKHSFNTNYNIQSIKFNLHKYIGKYFTTPTFTEFKNKVNFVY